MKAPKPKQQPIDEYIPLAQRLGMKKGAVVTSIMQGKDEVTAKAILGGVGQKRPAEAMFSKPNRDVEGPPTDALQKRVRAPENTGNATKP